MGLPTSPYVRAKCRGSYRNMLSPVRVSEPAEKFPIVIHLVGYGDETNLPKGVSSRIVSIENHHEMMQPDILSRNARMSRLVVICQHPSPGEECQQLVMP